VKFPAILDSGSEKNLCPKHYAINTDIRPLAQTVRAANHTNIAICGETTLGVMIGEQTFDTVFLVSEDINEILIGCEWMRENQLMWDFGRQTAYVRGLEIPMGRHTSSAQCRRLATTRVTAGPSRREISIPMYDTPAPVENATVVEQSKACSDVRQRSHEDETETVLKSLASAADGRVPKEDRKKSRANPMGHHATSPTNEYDLGCNNGQRPEIDTGWKPMDHAPPYMETYEMMMTNRRW
jgi:hypothetical protein